MNHIIPTAVGIVFLHFYVFQLLFSFYIGCRHSYSTYARPVYGMYDDNKRRISVVKQLNS